MVRGNHWVQWFFDGFGVRQPLVSMVFDGCLPLVRRWNGNIPSLKSSLRHEFEDGFPFFKLTLLATGTNVSSKTDKAKIHIWTNADYLRPLRPLPVTFFTQHIKILSIYASICRFWANRYIVTSYNTMHVAERHFLAGSMRLWKFFTTLPEGTRLLDF